MNNSNQQFNNQKEINICNMNKDPQTKKVTTAFVNHINEYQYSYNYTWMGRPIIQFPQDMLAMQEAIMKIEPDLIIETGVAHGGSAVFHASMLELLGDSCGVKREVAAVEIDLRKTNREAIDAHPMRKRITILEGSSTDPNIINQVSEIASRHKTIMVALDSLHTHSHVYEELKLYSPFVTLDSYIVVFDTIIEFMDKQWTDRPWGVGNNPYTAVQKWLGENDCFVCDKQFDNKSLVTMNMGGWLRRIK